MMEKYGVSNTKDLQEQELKQVKARLSELSSSHEKTAADTQETEELEKRAIELQIAIAEH